MTININDEINICNCEKEVINGGLKLRTTDNNYSLAVRCFGWLFIIDHKGAIHCLTNDELWYICKTIMSNYMCFIEPVKYGSIS